MGMRSSFSRLLKKYGRVAPRISVGGANEQGTVDLGGPALIRDPSNPRIREQKQTLNVDELGELREKQLYQETSLRRSAVQRRSIPPVSLSKATAASASSSYYRPATPTGQPPATVYREGRQEGKSTGPSSSLAFIPASTVASVARPGGRQSVSGIVATVWGSTGFVGRYIVNNLGRIGSQVVVPYRGDGFNTRHLKLAGDLGQIIPIPYEFDDIDSVRRAMSRSNVVINALGRHYDTPNYTIEDANVKLTYQLAKIAKDNGVDRFIHISHINASPDSSSRLFRAKAEAEQIVRHFFPDATIIRPATIFGLEDRFIHYYAGLGKRLYALPLTNHGKKIYTPTYVIDVARAVMNAITYGESIGETYALAGNQSFTERQIIDLISEHMYFKVRTMPLPETVARIYAKIISGDRTLPFIRPDAHWSIELINAILNRLRAPGWYNEDMVEQSKYNEYIPYGVKTYADLGVDVTPFTSQVDTILIPHKEQRGPDRWLPLGEKPSAASSL